MKNCHIEVFVTKTNRFRAAIKEDGREPYEVTVGGFSWSMGKGRKYRYSIKDKIHNILHALQEEANNAKF